MFAVVRILAFLVVVFFADVSAQESRIFENMREIFAEAKNFSAEFSVISQKLEGKAIYSKRYGEKIILGDYAILTKGDTVFNYNSKVNRLVISLREEEYSDFSLKAVLFDLPRRCKIIETGNSVELIPLEPQEENFSDLKIIAGSDNLPREIILTDAGGNVSKIELRNYKFNINLSGKDFELPTNEKTKVIDLR